MAEQFVELANGTNIGIESWPDSEEIVVETGGQPVIVSKYFGPLDLPDVRVRRDGDALVVEIELQHGWKSVPEGESIVPHDVRECRICAGDVWVELYRGNGPSVDDQPHP